MRIAVLGTRGIPANYGGFETFAENLSVQLVQRGHEVTVYGRSGYYKIKMKKYQGVQLVVLPNIMHKYLDTPSNTLFSSLHVMFQNYDVLLYCNSANAFFTFFPRLVGKKVSLNVDGLEWQRDKWNWFGKWVYKVSEMLSTVLPNCVVTDALVIQHYYRKKFRKESVLIPYGVHTGCVETDSILKKFGVERNKYFLYVSRLEPENNAHIVLEAFTKVRTDIQLVVVGNAPFSQSYIQCLKKFRDPRIVFTDYVFGKGYREFQSHAYAYVQATNVGGTHPALLEAMGHGNCVLANNVPEHREVLGDSGLYFSVSDINSLSQQMSYILEHPKEARAYGKMAMERVQAKYSWEKVTSDYEKLFIKMARKK